MAADLTITFKIGPTSNREKDIKNFNSASLARFARDGKAYIEQKYIDAVQTAAHNIAYDEFVSKMDSIQEFIRNDLDQFAREALKFFFSRKSSTTNPSLRISLDPLDFTASRSAFGWSIPDPDVTVKWPALRQKTIRNKRGNTTYFVHKGDLYNLLSTSLFPFLKVTLSPTIQVTKEKAPKSTDKTSARIATVTFSLAASKKGVNLGNVPALKTGDFRMPTSAKPAADFELIKKYISDKVAFKLTNIDHQDLGDFNRPLVSPLLGYYVVVRFPKVLEAAIKKHFKVRPSAKNRFYKPT